MKFSCVLAACFDAVDINEINCVDKYAGILFAFASPLFDMVAVPGYARRTFDQFISVCYIRKLQLSESCESKISPELLKKLEQKLSKNRFYELVFKCHGELSIANFNSYI